MTNYIYEGSLWTLHNHQPTVIVFGRDADNPLVTKTFGFSNQRPYFYAPAAECDANRRPSEIVEMEEGYFDAFNRPVTKCYTVLPSDVPKVRGLFSFTCEADILYDYRYLIDHNMYYGFNDQSQPVDVPIVHPRTCFFDIEIDSPQDEFPDAADAKWPICQIQVMDSITNQTVVWTLGGVKQADDHVVCETEEQLIKQFVGYVWDTDPDLMAGWYILGFDVPYIINRARHLKVDVCRLSRWPSKYPTEDKWVGRELFDMLVFYKDWSKPKGQLSSYDLKKVVQHECKWTYTDYGDQIRRLVVSEDWATLVDYGRNDVLALSKIDKETGLIEFYEALRRMTGIKLTDCLLRSKIIELYLMHEIHVEGITMPLPTKKHDAEKVNYEGALVLQPTFGVHDDVGVLDAKALYPSIILAFNISPDRYGMIPKVITKLMEARDVMRRLKMEGKASKSMLTSEQSLKYVINSFYGYLAFTGARLHKPELAAFVTGKGQDIATSIHQMCRELGYTVVYADTDSSFFKTVRTPQEGKMVEGKVNDYLLLWARQHGVADAFAPTVKFEKLYQSLMFKKKPGSDEAAKKRYAGIVVWKDGADLELKYNEKAGIYGSHMGGRYHNLSSTYWLEVDYTGLEVKRSDTADVSRTMMKVFFNMVLIDHDVKGAAVYVREVYTKVLSGDIPLVEVAIPKGITKGKSHMDPSASPWIRGKETGRKLLGIKFGNKKPMLLYCTGYKNAVDSRPDVICIDADVDEKAVLQVCTIDWQTQAMKVVEMKMKSLLESVGLSWEREVLGQQGLEQWFG